MFNLQRVSSCLGCDGKPSGVVHYDQWRTSTMIERTNGVNRCLATCPCTQVYTIYGVHHRCDDGLQSINRPLSRRLDRCDRVIQKESGDPNGGNMCSVSGATGTSRVRHNAHYVPYAQIRFDLLTGSTSESRQPHSRLQWSFRDMSLWSPTCYQSASRPLSTFAT